MNTNRLQEVLILRAEALARLRTKSTRNTRSRRATGASHLLHLQRLKRPHRRHPQNVNSSAAFLLHHQKQPTQHEIDLLLQLRQNRSRDLHDLHPHLLQKRSQLALQIRTSETKVLKLLLIHHAPHTHPNPPKRHKEGQRHHHHRKSKIEGHHLSVRKFHPHPLASGSRAIWLGQFFRQ